MERIQIIVILINIIFLLFISWLIIKGKLREEYAIVWIICTIGLVIFSFWRNGLEILAHYFGIIDPPNLVFTGFIFIILIYLLNLSIVNSRLHKNITSLAQELALLKQELTQHEKTTE